MVRAKREYEGGLFAFAAAVIVAHIPFTGANLNPDRINPYRHRDPATESQRDAVRRHLNWAKLAVRAAEAFALAGITVEGASGGTSGR